MFLAVMKGKVRVTLQLTVSRSVRLGVEPFRDSWHFGFSRDSCGFVCRGASSLSRGWVCLV